MLRRRVLSYRGSMGLIGSDPVMRWLLSARRRWAGDLRRRWSMGRSVTKGD
jgi:hypothetical protein